MRAGSRTWMTSPSLFIRCWKKTGTPSWRTCGSRLRLSVKGLGRRCSSTRWSYLGNAVTRDYSSMQIPMRWDFTRRWACRRSANAPRKWKVSRAFCRSWKSGSRTHSKTRNLRLPYSLRTEKNTDRRQDGEYTPDHGRCTFIKGGNKVFKPYQRKNKIVIQAAMSDQGILMFSLDSEIIEQAFFAKNPNEIRALRRGAFGYELQISSIFLCNQIGLK